MQDLKQDITQTIHKMHRRQMQPLKSFPLPKLARPPKCSTQDQQVAVSSGIEDGTANSKGVSTGNSPDKTEQQLPACPKDMVQTAPQLPVVSLVGLVSVNARGHKALQQVCTLTAKQAANQLGTTPRQIRKARAGSRTALIKLAKCVSVEDIIEEVKAVEDIIEEVKAVSKQLETDCQSQAAKQPEIEASSIK